MLLCHSGGELFVLFVLGDEDLLDVEFLAAEDVLSVRAAVRAAAAIRDDVVHLAAVEADAVARHRVYAELCACEHRVRHGGVVCVLHVLRHYQRQLAYLEHDGVYLLYPVILGELDDALDRLDGQCHLVHITSPRAGLSCARRCPLCAWRRSCRSQ